METDENFSRNCYLASFNFKTSIRDIFLHRIEVPWPILSIKGQSIFTIFHDFRNCLCYKKRDCEIRCKIKSWTGNVLISPEMFLKAVSHKSFLISSVHMAVLWRTSLRALKFLVSPILSIYMLRFSNGHCVYTGLYLLK